MPFTSPISVFDTSFFNGPHLEVATRIIGFGQAFKAHHLYQSLPDGVPHGDEIIEVGTRYHDVTYAVMAGDNTRKKERELLGQKAVQSTVLALNWAGMRYLRENNLEYITNLAVDHAPTKSPSRSTSTAAPNAPSKVILEHGKISTTLHLILGKVAGAVTYIAQACQGDPNDESNWNLEWQFTKIKGGVELTGLEPGKIYYVRVRCLGHAGLGPWSTYVHIMVV